MVCSVVMNGIGSKVAVLIHIPFGVIGIAIRAGRNLPDKEFRYLRTVIVTAAVYRGFDSRLRLR